MLRHEMIKRIGSNFLRANLESSDEWSYARDVGNVGKLKEAMNNGIAEELAHYKLDIRFTDDRNPEKSRLAVLIETKHIFTKNDEKQLRAYVDEEHALHPHNKVIAILANIDNDKIKVWKQSVDDENLLKKETVLQSLDHYKKLFSTQRQNDREKVMKSTYELNEILHKYGISEKKRSQFVGTCLLYIKSEVDAKSLGGFIGQKFINDFKKNIDESSPNVIVTYISDVLENLLDGSREKNTKVTLLKKNVLHNQHVKALSTTQWSEILVHILQKIYRYIDSETAEGQDILNLFFVTFNKYAGKTDKNQAFTPDHITDFMSRLTGVNKDSVVLDATCGSGSFLVQAMAHELKDVKIGHTDEEANMLGQEIKANHIYGIESEENAYGLATTNMLIHSDGNSNIELGNCFEREKFIVDAHPNIILMNPPYNARPSTIPEKYKHDWPEKTRNGKEDPTKGLVFVKYLAEIAEKSKWINTKMAVLLPMSAAIGSSKVLAATKKDILDKNTLDAVFSLPPEIFYPGAAVESCCMLFTLNVSHFNDQGVPKKKTFFGHYRDDGFKKKKNLGRVEQFDDQGKSYWKSIEDR